MKKILLATTLLSIAVSENIPMENYPRSTDWTRDNQFWNKKTKRALRSDIRSEVDEFSNYNDDRQFSQISDTHLISGIMKLPSVPVIRQPALVQFKQIDLPPSTKSKFGEPAILISIGIQDKMNTRGDSQKKCLTRNLERGQELQLAQPFYVEEPKWIEIDTDDIDNLPRRIKDDPYIMSRGKKNFKFKGIDQLNNIMPDSEELFGYPSRSKILPKANRVKKSADGIDQKNTNSMENIEEKETDVFEQKMKNNIRIGKLGDLKTYDNLFVLSRGKKVSNNEDSNNKNRYNTKKMDNERRTEKNDIKTKTESQLIDRSNLKNLLVRKLNLHNREKRNACKDFVCKNKLAHQQNQWLMNWIKDIQGLSSYLERRDKHSDLLDLLNTPYVISRGKKASYEVKDDLHSTMELNDDDVNHIETINRSITKNLLKTLIDRSKCNNDNCDIDGDRLIKSKIWRDRRDSLDEILAKYDPYYVTRGKRMHTDHFLNKVQLL